MQVTEQYTCPFCSSDIVMLKTREDNWHCSFCNIILGPKSKYGMYVKNHERRKAKRFHLVTEELATSHIDELLSLHTADLIHLLRLVREKRTEEYNLLRIFNKAIETSDADNFLEIADEKGGDYEEWTRYSWRIENILLERLGYLPQRITNELIFQYNEKCKKEQKPMNISKKKKVRQ